MIIAVRFAGLKVSKEQSVAEKWNAIRAARAVSEQSKLALLSPEDEKLVRKPSRALDYFLQQYCSIYVNLPSNKFVERSIQKKYRKLYRTLHKS